ncbi:MAG: hypothetical protein WKG07_03770 [Hymenobacter sp.]
MHSWDGSITERRRFSTGEIFGQGSLLALTAHTGVARLNATQALGTHAGW